MIKHIYILIIFILLGNVVLAQDDYKYTLKSGVGYFSKLNTEHPGSVAWFEGGVNTSNGFYTNLRVAYGVMTSIMGKETGPFEGQTMLSLYFMSHITFTRPINFYGNHFFEPGVGFHYTRGYRNSPSYDISVEFDEHEDSFLVYLGIDAGYEPYNNAGLTFVADYYYQFNNGFYLGFRTDFYSSAFLFEAITVSPVFGVRF
ncbi:MAG: hypothetical protein ACLFNU_01805 [Bacteroidales bacterium]